MRASETTYEKVAERCHAFSVVGNDAYTNRTRDTEKVSCVNCRHFDSEAYCVLDLYDQIVPNVEEG